MHQKIRSLAIAAGTVLLIGAMVAQGASAAPPSILATTVSKVGLEAATLVAEINPQGQEGSYHFEYGPEDCSKIPSTCTQVPVPDGVLVAGSEPVPVSFPLEGLTPGTTYHLRVVASNPDGKKEGPDRVFATYSPALKGLPDARAYEQASPVKKNGADARGTATWVKAADDGGAITYLSTSGLPGGVGEQEIPSYLSSRGESDWSTQGLLPPATLGSEAYVLGWLPDFSTVFDLANDFPALQDGVFLARSSADGTLEQVVSHGEGANGSTSYAGASADGSRVIFELRAKLPCCNQALADKGNLYLWDRISGQISLVSVLNDEKPPVEGAVAGPYDWMRTASLPLLADGGGSASEYYVQDMNAVSDGGAVFFTAIGSGALYERTNPTAPQSPLNGEGKCTDPVNLACTLQVSASQINPPDPLGQRPAAFMAASADGKSAFFTSPEKLTADANTGPVQPLPAIERASVSGPPVLEKLPSIIASGIAKDAEHLYWVNPVEGAIGRSDLDGKNPKPAFIPIPPLKTKDGEGKDIEVAAKPQYVAVDSEHIYWSSEGEGKSKEGVIGRASIDGKDESIEAEWIKGASRPRGIAVNSEFIYWANAGDGTTENGSIGRAKKIDGGEVKQDFVPGNGTLSPQGIAVDGSHVYWSTADPNGNGGSIRRVKLDGSNQEFKFIDVGVQLRGVAVDAGHIYWASQGEEAIGRMPLGEFTVLGGCGELPSCEKQFIPTAGKPKGLAIDATDLRWSVNGETAPNPGNDLYRYRAEGEELEDITADETDPNGAEVKGVLGASTDGKRIYFAANGDLDAGGKAQPGDCQGKLGSVFEFSGQCSLYLAEESSPGSWSTSFIARLDAGGKVDESDAMDWSGKAGAHVSEKSAGNTSQKSAFASADGGALLFRSQRQLTEYDNEGQPELYRYDAGADALSCLSCNPTGEAPLGPVGLGSIGLSTLFPQQNTALTLSRNLSADGSRAFFESPDPLVIDDTNGEGGCESEGAAFFPAPSCLDAYEWEAEGTGSCQVAVQAGGCLYLLSTGKSPHASFFADASLNGNDAFIATRSAGLVRQDQDQLQDIYDTRAGGGLASQNQQPPVECESLDGCHGPQSTPPASQSPATTSPGPGNTKHPRKKAKKHKHKKKQKQKKAAHKSGGKNR
jgi:sugar lactone lactonase YvrE